jgi:hypothetical protein
VGADLPFCLIPLLSIQRLEGIEGVAHVVKFAIAFQNTSNLARKYGHARLSISTREPIGQSRNTKLVKTRPSHIHILPVRVRQDWNLDNEAGAFYAIHVPLQLFSY